MNNERKEEIGKEIQIPGFPPMMSIISVDNLNGATSNPKSPPGEESNMNPKSIERNSNNRCKRLE